MKICCSNIITTNSIIANLIFCQSSIRLRNRIHNTYFFCAGASALLSRVVADGEPSLGWGRTQALSGGGETITLLAFTAEAPRQVQALCVVLTYRPVLALVYVFIGHTARHKMHQVTDMWHASRLLPTSEKVQNCPLPSERDGHGDWKAGTNLRRWAACHCRWSLPDTRTWSCRSCWCRPRSHTHLESPGTRQYLTNNNGFLTGNYTLYTYQWSTVMSSISVC